MNLKIAVFCALLFIFKSRAQKFDTLIYLKEIEAKKDNFVGKPFSNLYRGLKIKPNAFTCHNFIYSLQTDFNFGINILEIVWMNSPYDENVEICKTERNKSNSKKEFKKLKIKDIRISDDKKIYFPDNYHKPILDIKEFAQKKLDKSALSKNISFADLSYIIRPLTPIKVQNTIDKRKISFTRITYVDKTHKNNSEIDIIIYWMIQINYKDLKNIEKNSFDIFSDKYYDFYWNRTIKYIKIASD